MEDAKKAKDQAEQEGYDVGVAETEEAFRTEEAFKAEVSRVCRAYCIQVWNKALNLDGVEASSTPRRAENEYYPLVMQAIGSSASLDDATPNVASPIE